MDFMDNQIVFFFLSFAYTSQLYFLESHYSQARSIIYVSSNAIT
jgi:hypothetical protein